MTTSKSLVHLKVFNISKSKNDSYVSVLILDVDRVLHWRPQSVWRLPLRLSWTGVLFYGVRTKQMGYNNEMPGDDSNDVERTGIVMSAGPSVFFFGFFQKGRPRVYIVFACVHTRHECIPYTTTTHGIRFVGGGGCGGFEGVRARASLFILRPVVPMLLGKHIYHSLLYTTDNAMENKNKKDA